MPKREDLSIGRERYWTRARCGDMVYDIDDPRHIAWLDAIIWSATARLTYQDSGFRGECPVGNLRRAEWSPVVHQ